MGDENIQIVAMTSLAETLALEWIYSSIEKTVVRWEVGI